MAPGWAVVCTGGRASISRECHRIRPGRARYAAASTTSLGWETEEDIRTAVAALKETAMTEYASRC